MFMPSGSSQALHSARQLLSTCTARAPGTHQRNEQEESRLVGNHKMNKSWQRLVVVFTTVLVTSVPSFLQAAEGVKKEGRFTLNAKGTPWIEDETQLLRKFDLHLQWWTLLGEPIEYYDFRWYLNDQYWLPDGGRITRNELKKYPDLLKRFDAIRPRRMDLLITGSFSNDDKGKQTAPPVVAPFYSRGNYKFLRTEFAYFIPDRKLMITRSGEVGHGIVPGSPKDWEYFLQYPIFYDGVTMFESLVKDNNGLRNGAEKLDESSLQYRRKQLREVFREATKVEVFVQIANIEWPMSELQAIAQRFREYESGEREPTPQEIVKERVEKEAGSLTEYSGDEFWSVPDPELDPRIEIYQVGKKSGVRNKSTGETIIPPGKYRELRVIGEKYILTEVGVKTIHQCGEDFTETVWMAVLRDAKGVVRIDRKFALTSAKMNKRNQIVVLRPRCYEYVEIERDVAPGQWYMPESRKYQRGTRFTYDPGTFSVVGSEPYREDEFSLYED